MKNTDSMIETPIKQPNRKLSTRQTETMEMEIHRAEQGQSNVDRKREHT